MWIQKQVSTELQVQAQIALTDVINENTPDNWEEKLPQGINTLIFKKQNTK